MYFGLRTLIPETTGSKVNKNRTKKQFFWTNLDCGLIRQNQKGFSAKRVWLDCWVHPGADQANTWRPGIGVVHHACGGRADVVGWTGSTGPGGPAT